MSNDPSTDSGNPSDDKALLLYTLGHGDLSPEAFLNLLRQFGIEQVIDVRGVPSSRHTPQFDKSVLSPFLRIRRIKYLHLKGLGGLRRHARIDSVNAGWRNASLRGFADYMQTPPFAVALNRLVQVARVRVTAIICSELLPWRCHRSLIADALVIRDVRVMHILSEDHTVAHALSPLADVQETKVTYPAKSHPNSPVEEV